MGLELVIFQQLIFHQPSEAARPLKKSPPFHRAIHRALKKSPPFHSDSSGAEKWRCVYI